MRGPILITGAARSGTSMVAGIITRCGAFGGRLGKGLVGNPRGNYENIEIREMVVKRYLYKLNVDLRGQNPLPDVMGLLPYPELRDEVEKIMIHHEYEDGPWFYKGAKLCLIWPTWFKAFPDAKWIIVRRDDESIAKSCLNTSFMNAYTEKEDWLKWVKVHRHRFCEMQEEPNLVCKEIWPMEIVQGKIGPIKQLVQELGLTWRDDAVKGFVSKEQWGSHHG